MKEVHGKEVLNQSTLERYSRNNLGVSHSGKANDRQTYDRLQASISLSKCPLIIASQHRA